MPDINAADLNTRLDVLSTATTPEVETTTLDSTMVSQLASAVDTYRTETLGHLRKWIDGQGPAVDANELAAFLAGPAIKLSEAAIDFVTGSMHIAEAAAMLGSEGAKDKADALRPLVKKGRMIQVASAVPAIGRRIATHLIAKQLTNLEPIAATYGKQLATKLEAKLPELRAEYAAIDFPALMRDKLEDKGYALTDAQEQTLGQLAREASSDTIDVVEKLIARLKSDRPIDVPGLLQTLGQGGVSLYHGLEGLVADGGALKAKFDPDGRLTAMASKLGAGNLTELLDELGRKNPGLPG